MLTLFQFGPAFRARNVSPFCLKMETWLRMAGIEHEIAWCTSTRNAPKGKLPYINDDGHLIGDSELIIDYLTDKFGDRLDAGLNVEQRAQSLVWRRLFEDSLIFPLLYSRWIDPAGWELMQRVFEPLPPPKREQVAVAQRETVRQRLIAQGIGVHSPEEIYRLGLKSLDAIAVQLGNHPFMLGAAPTSLDATAY